MQGELKTFETILLKCDEPYASGRIYPKEVVEKAVEKFNKEFGILYIETPGNETETVDMSKIVGAINDMHLDGKEVKGTAVLLDTPEANKIKDLNLKVSLVGHGWGDWHNDPIKITEYEIDKAVVGVK